MINLLFEKKIHVYVALIITGLDAMLSIMFYWVCFLIYICTRHRKWLKKFFRKPGFLLIKQIGLSDSIVSFLFLKTTFIMVYEGLNYCPVWLWSNRMRSWDRVVRTNMTASYFISRLESIIDISIWVTLHFRSDKSMFEAIYSVSNHFFHQTYIFLV